MRRTFCGGTWRRSQYSLASWRELLLFWVTTTTTLSPLSPAHARSVTVSRITANAMWQRFNIHHVWRKRPKSPEFHRSGLNGKKVGVICVFFCVFVCGLSGLDRMGRMKDLLNRAEFLNTKDAKVTKNTKANLY